MSIIERLEPGFYAKGQNGGFYKVELPIRMRPSKTINLETGEVKYATNADRIRAMADEELAELLDRPRSEFRKYENCDDCPDDIYCKDCLLEWLKMECES